MSKPRWIDYDASRRGTLVLPEGTKVRSCAEPAPDVALSVLAKLEAAVKVPEGVDASTKAELNQQAAELAGRTQMVLFLREALFRLCEQSLNGAFPPQELAAAYRQVIDAAGKMVDTAHKNAEARLKSADAEQQDAKARLESTRRLPMR